MPDMLAKPSGAGQRASGGASRWSPLPAVLIACLLLSACLRLHATRDQPSDEVGCSEITYLLASNERVAVFFFIGGTITRRTIHPDTYALPKAACQVRDPDLVKEEWLNEAELSQKSASPDQAAAVIATKEHLAQSDIVVLRIAPATEEFVLTSELAASTLSSKPVTLVVYTTRENMKARQ